MFGRSLFWISIAYLAGIWLYCVPFTGDEKTYIATSMEMWNAKSWLHPILMGEHSYFKPPFQYWATLVGWSLFGFNSLGTFIPSALAVIATAWFLSRISILVSDRNREVTPAAGLWFAAAAGTITYGGSAQMEIWIVLFHSAAWYAGLRFLETNQTKWIVTALLIAGLASLVKSPLYSVLWVLSFWIYLALDGKLAAMKKGPFWCAHVLGVAAGLAWFVAVYLTDRDRFWNHYVLRETLSKSGGNSAGILHMWADFSTFCMPYLLLFFPALATLVRQNDRRSSISRFLIAWCALPAIFFSIFPYRTETYLYILIPAAALIMDWGLRGADFGRWTRWIARFNGVLVFAFLGVLASILVFSGMIPALLGIALALAAIPQLAFSWNFRPERLAFALVGLVLAFRVAAVSLGEQDIADLRDAVAQNPGRPVVFFDDGKNIWHEVGLLSTAIGKPCERKYSVDELLRSLDEGALVVLNQWQAESQLPELRQKAPAGRLKERSWWRWQRAFQVPTAKDMANLGNRNAPDWRKRHQREYKILSF